MEDTNFFVGETRQNPDILEPKPPLVELHPRIPQEVSGLQYNFCEYCLNHHSEIFKKATAIINAACS